MRLPSRPSSKISPSSLYTTQFPYTGTSVMLMLKPEDDYDVEVMQVRALRGKAGFYFYFLKGCFKGVFGFA